MSTSSPMASMRPVPGAGPAASSSSEEATGNLASLAPDSEPQTGASEQDHRDTLMAQAKKLQENAALMASVDPTFGKFSQRINAMIMEYLQLLARKSGKMRGEDQPRL